MDTPLASVAVSGPFTIAGWALDPQAVSGSGSGAVHVWAYRRDVPSVPQFLGGATINGARIDVAQAFGAQFQRAAWSVDVSTPAPGTYNLLVYAWSARTHEWGPKVVRITTW